MADVNRGNRPLSPHMTIYRWPLNMAVSILTRITGNALLVGALLVVAWFLSAAISPTCFATMDGLMTGWFGDLVMVLSLWGLWFHALAGLRHLYWDTGRGLEIETSEKLSWGIIVGSVVLTVLTVVII